MLQHRIEARQHHLPFVWRRRLPGSRMATNWISINLDNGISFDRRNPYGTNLSTSTSRATGSTRHRGKWTPYRLPLWDLNCRVQVTSFIKQSTRRALVLNRSRICFVRKHSPKTILPSPDPRSKTFPLLPSRAVRTFRICSFVAGTKGKQIFLKAGLTKGAHITVRVTAIPPVSYKWDSLLPYTLKTI